MNCFTVPQKKKEGLILNFSCHKRTAVIGCEAGGGGEGGGRVGGPSDCRQCF